ncbi:DUF3619 family protein [Pararobbsia silviterrae]|uniref:DUF3619 family protein n=1 Tax=Pararobbsia silviterrae TaxID=1792498 RepID=A0A494Y3W8_9BURK|nr:DUF3619 family protein [Pararobbsia silviterrae]RKP57439.1 DUF3619 family protein [Pararobbsia silviterrae]
MNSTLETREVEFAHALRCALEESVADLPAPALERLAAARAAALARKKPETVEAPVFVPAFAGAGAPVAAPDAAPRAGAGRRPLRGLAILAPLAALVIVLIGVASWEDQRRIDENADIDAAMLSDDVPLSAYLDHGFHAYLSHSR